MPNTNPFHFKKFTVNQDKCAMKVGTDGVLLGCWARVKNNGKILDVGSGTALITLMLAQRTMALLTAIDIDEGAFVQSQENIVNSPWCKRITSLLGNIKDYNNDSERFTDIVSNPPFFSKSLKSSNHKRNLARHQETLSLKELFAKSSELLTEDGCVHIIFPFTEEHSVLECARKNGLFLHELCRVSPMANVDPNRSLFRFGFEYKPAKIESLCILSGLSNDYSEKFKELTKEYYL